jgi:serine/threonine protein phosphatase 1
MKHTARRLIAVGDIHGQAQMLIELLGRIGPCDSDCFVFLGDYIDRGPASAAVIELLVAFSRQFPHSVFLRGNHEQMLLDAFDGLCNRMPKWDDGSEPAWEDLPDELLLYLVNGGATTLKSYREQYRCKDNELKIPQAHLDFLRSSRFSFRFDKYLFVHAGINPQDPYGRQDGCQAMLWSRDQLWLQDPDWELTVVHGHTPVLTPLIAPYDINLDTGAGIGFKLTAFDLYSRKLWQV